MTESTAKLAALRAAGVFRVADNPLVLSVGFNRRPTDDELREVHETLAALSPSSAAGETKSPLVIPEESLVLAKKIAERPPMSEQEILDGGVAFVMGDPGGTEHAPQPEQARGVVGEIERYFTIVHEHGLSGTYAQRAEDAAHARYLLERARDELLRLQGIIDDASTKA